MYIYFSGTWEILKKWDAPSISVLINQHFLLNSDNILDSKILLYHTEIQDHSCKSYSQLTKFTAGKEWSQWTREYEIQTGKEVVCEYGALHYILHRSP